MKNLVTFKMLILTALTLIFSNITVSQTIAKHDSKELLVKTNMIQRYGFDTNDNKTKKELRTLDRQCVKLDMTVYIDNQLKDSDGYKLTISNITAKFYLVPLESSNQFIVYLNFDTEYEIEVSHPGYTSKKIKVNTNAPYDNWYLIAQVRLDKSPYKPYVGEIKYNNKKQTFETVKI